MEIFLLTRIIITHVGIHMRLYIDTIHGTGLETMPILHALRVAILYTKHRKFLQNFAP